MKTKFTRHANVWTMHVEVSDEFKQAYEDRDAVREFANQLFTSPSTLSEQVAAITSQLISIYPKEN